MVFLLLVFLFEMIVLPLNFKEKRQAGRFYGHLPQTISMVIGGIALLFVPF